MSSRWDRLGPLVGVAFVVLLAVAFAVGGSEPARGASAATVVSWYTAHRGSVRFSDYLMTVVVVVGLFFFGYLRDRLARGASGLAATAFGGAVLFAAGGVFGAGVQLGLADNPRSLAPAAAHALNLLQGYATTIAVAAGAAVLLLAASVAILRTAELPAWTGWLGIVCGVVVMVPVRSIGPLPAGIWTLAVAIVMLVRGSEVSAVRRSGAQAVPGEAL